MLLWIYSIVDTEESMKLISNKVVSTFGCGKYIIRYLFCTKEQLLENVVTLMKRLEEKS